MKAKHLHIVALNIPFPANYGGAIDIYYKVKALHEIGYTIHLHCFEYGRKRAEQLNSICESVNYYPRKMHWVNLLSKTPFIVKSRTSTQLLDNLIAKPFPIIYEGLHSCAYLNHPKLKGVPQYVRAHNIEQDYYRLLAQSEKSLFYKMYLYLEHLKIKKFEFKLFNATGVFAISDKDQEYFKEQATSYIIRAFHPDTKVKSKTGLGNYALYHGNLSVAENENAALFLIKTVFKHLNYDLVIAGKNPSSSLRKEIRKHYNVRLVEDPQNSILDKLIQEAHIQVLPTEQDTGIKLKLLKALYLGRHCVVNTKMVNKTGLEKACYIVNNQKEWLRKIKELQKIPFEDSDIQKRTELLKSYDNSLEAAKMDAIIFPPVPQSH